MTDQNLHPVLTHYIAWIKSHEKLLIIVLSAWLAFHFYGKGLDAWIEHDKRIATIAQAKVQTDATANQTLTQQVADLKQQLTTLSAQAQARQQERIVYVQQQKKKNDEAVPSELATQIATLLKIQPQEVTASPVDGTLVFSNAAAHTDANALVDGQEAQAELADLRPQLSACTTIVKKDDDLIVGLNTQLKDEQASHKADVSLERVKAKKAWRNGFKWGFGTGIATAIVVKIAKIF